MKIIRGLDEITKIGKPYLTMGGFDGVHLGHQEIVKKIISEARKNKGFSCLLTFDPHPRHVLQKDSNLKLITSLDIKARKLEKLGLDFLIVIPFTLEFSKMSSLEFVRDVLVNKIGMHSFYVGYDHHFGKNREGNFDQLSLYAKEFGFNLKEIKAVDLGETTISSTKIREALQNGNLDYATKALGDFFEFEGLVVRGDGIGNGLGFPTANLEVLPHQLVPKNGVYKVNVTYREENYLGMMNVGLRPSINSKSVERRIEVHLFDFNQNLYGESIYVQFLKRTRDEKKFASLEELSEQLAKDKAEILSQ